MVSCPKETGVRSRTREIPGASIPSSGAAWAKAIPFERTISGLKMGEVTPGIYDLDPMSHDFNFFTINGRCFPYVTPLKIKLGENVWIRFGNFGHDAHPMHIHGHQFTVSASDGNTRGFG